MLRTCYYKTCAYPCTAGAIDRRRFAVAIASVCTCTCTCMHHCREPSSSTRDTVVNVCVPTYTCTRFRAGTRARDRGRVHVHCDTHIVGKSAQQHHMGPNRQFWTLPACLGQFSAAVLTLVPAQSLRSAFTQARSRCSSSCGPAAASIIVKWLSNMDVSNDSTVVWVQPSPSSCEWALGVAKQAVPVVSHCVAVMQATANSAHRVCIPPTTTGGRHCVCHAAFVWKRVCCPSAGRSFVQYGAAGPRHALSG